MDNSKKIYTLKPAKKFYKITFLFFCALFALLTCVQTIISLTSPFYLYLGVFLIPLTAILIYVFYIYYYRNPLKNEMRLEESSLFINIFSRKKQEQPFFKLDLRKINTILLYQAVLDKILNLRTISLRIKLKKGYEISLSHVFFDKTTLLFFKMLFKQTELEKKQLEIDLKMNPDYVKVLSKII